MPRYIERYNGVYFNRKELKKMKVYFGINDFIEKISLVKITYGTIEFVKFPYTGKDLGKGAVWSKDYIDRVDMIIVPEDPFAQLNGFVRNECDIVRTISYECFPEFINNKVEEYKDDAVMFRLNRVRVKVSSESVIDDEGRDCYFFSADVGMHVVAEVPSIQYDSNVFPVYNIRGNDSDKTIRRFRVSNANGSYRDFDSSSGRSVVGRSSMYVGYTMTSPVHLYTGDFPKMPEEINGFKFKEYITEFSPEVIISD